ncbi:putative chaperonin (GroES/Cpn10) [Aspergillus thermomutatus]|uniref:10 kDa chaperonin n=1 Tax=Aspergillus thermomutatus TaxID=41047 RepID=A0A397G9C2_ASPTH|nr:uncharacterized protein CDV56_102699 [Aspergillus thermomutatus]RHZ46218.1 hypothetical protein CDV56_102699 [Aspergillus thermomutatus]
MLSRTFLLALVGAASFATINAQSCSSSNKKCCQQIQDSDNLDATALSLLNLVGLDADALTGSIGLQCTNVIANTCSAEAACCTGNNYVDIGKYRIEMGNTDVHTYLCPQENTVIIQPEDEITHFGTASKGTKTMKPARGVVLAVGRTKALGDGAGQAMDVRLGDLIIYTKGKGKEVRVDNDEYLILNRDEILAVAD